MEEEKKIKKTVIGNPMMFISQVKQWFKSKPLLQKVLIIFAGIGILFVIYIASVLVRYKDLSVNDTSNIADNNETDTSGKEVFSKNDAGIVCAGENNFSFRVKYPYAIMSNDKDGIALITDYGLVTVSSGGENTANKLKEFGVAFTKEGDTYFYQVPTSGSADRQKVKRIGMTSEKDQWKASIFYIKDYEENAKLILSAVLESLNEGCN